LATATRPTGIVLVLPLLVRYWERVDILSVPGPGDGGADGSSGLRVLPGWVAEAGIPARFDRTRLSARAWLPAAAALGVAGYMLYGWVGWGNPFAFVAEQERYHGRGWRLLIKQQYFDAWSQGWDGRHLATTTAQAVLVALVLFSVAAVGARLGWGYGLFVLGLGALPALTVSTFMGSGRYLIPAFPLWAVLGERLSTRRWLLGAYGLFSMGVLVWLTVGFGRSWYLT
jgi:hypothetical protein